MTRSLFSPGDRVRVRRSDPEGHTRVPGYTRGCTGVVQMLQGVHAAPDERAMGVREPSREPVYTVLFRSQDLWATDNFGVCVDLWERYLEGA